MKKQYLCLGIFFLLINIIPAQGFSITDQPGDVSWVSTRTDSYIIKYKTDADGAISYDYHRTLVYSLDGLQPCEAGMTGNTKPGGGYWWKQDLVLDLYSLMNDFLDLALINDYYADATVGFDTDSENGYICILLRIQFIEDSTKQTATANILKIKVYKNKTPDQGSGVFDLPVSPYASIIALGLLVLLKRRRI